MKNKLLLNSWTTVLLALGCLLTVWMTGCHHEREVSFSPSCAPCQDFLQQIEYPDASCAGESDGTEFMTGPPMTVSNFEQLEPWNLTVDQCVEMTLANSKVMNKLGGVVVSAPQAASTLYDQALFETNPFGSVEAALSAFDAQWNSSLMLNHDEPPFIGATELFGSRKTDGGNLSMGLSKQTASGASFTLGSDTIYQRLGSPSPFNPTRKSWTIQKRIEMRQPLLRNRGTQINRIAGPNATPGNYNGVLISRIRSDISLADFEASVRDLVRDVVNNYWLLYFGYRDLDTAILARNAARSTWANRKLRLDNGIGRPDDEAQARQQYYRFDQLAQTALVGIPQGRPGVLGAERELRRLMGLPVYDGKVIRPMTEPITAPVAFNWEDSQIQTLGRRVEVRRQKWQVRQRELELVAAKQLYRWRFDLVGNYQWQGWSPYQWFGDNAPPPYKPAPPNPAGTPYGPASAWNGLMSGDLDGWNLGVELSGALGNRQGHLAIRNAELNLTRERALLKEQQRQLLHDLSSAFSEVDRAFEAMRVSFNQRVAVQAELEPKRKRVEEGQDQVFFLLDAQQRAATAESDVHRSISDYNRALMQYAFTTGSLLSRYNIYLTEGPWSEDAQRQAEINASRLQSGKMNTEWLDTCPVSYGPYEQLMPGPAAISTDEPIPATDPELPLLLQEGKD